MGKSSTSFKPGQSGNPKGRPRKGHEYYKRLTKVVTYKDMEEIAKKAVEQAKHGDRYARDWVSWYMMGKPKELIDLNVSGKKPIQFVNVETPEEPED